MVTLVVREVELEQVEPFVDRLGEPEFPHEELNGADPTAGDGLCLGGGLVADVRGGEDRLRRGCGGGSIEPLADFPLAGGVVSVWNRFHSKSPCGLGQGICVGRSNVPETPGDFEFPLTFRTIQVWDHAWLRSRASFLMLNLSILSLAIFLEANGSLSESDLDKIQGTWEIVSMEINGEVIQAGEGELIGESFIIFKDDKFRTEWKWEGRHEVYDTKAFKLDSTQSPKHFDILENEEPFKGKLSKGIYKFEGNLLKICVDGGKRPSTFDAGEFSNRTFFVFKKIAINN